jgi:hypothetical protein
MRIEITTHYFKDGKEYYRFELWDGPDGIEHVQGFAIDLIETFSKIVEWRERIAVDYAEEIEQEIKNLEIFENFFKS